MTMLQKILSLLRTSARVCTTNPTILGTTPLPDLPPKNKNTRKLTTEKFFQIFPKAKTSKLDTAMLVEALNELFTLDLTTINRQASFLAQCSHESAQFTVSKENLNYSATALRQVFSRHFPTEEIAAQYARQPERIANRAYANRMGNGPESSGDGWKYRGRGLIQLTGRYNYVNCGKDLGIDLIRNPEYLESTLGALESAVWFWTKNNLNKFADADDIRGQTKAINGGFNGLQERIDYYEKAKRALQS